MCIAPHSLRRNIRAAVSGNAFYALCQFGMLVALVRLTNPTEVGRYALALAIAGPAFVFANLKLRQIQVTDARGDYTFGQYLGQRLVTTCVVTMLVSGLGALWMERSQYLMLAAVVVVKALESIIDIAYGAMQRRERLPLVARAQLWRGGVGLVVFAVAAAATKSASWAVVALSATTTVQMVMNLVRVRRLDVAVRPSFVGLGPLTLLALPLGAAVSVSAWATNVPRYFLGAESPEAVGIFAALAYLMVASGLVMGSVSEAASARLANLYAAADPAFGRTVGKLVALGAGVGVLAVVGALLLGYPVLLVVYGEEYAAEVEVLWVLSAAALVQYTFTFLGTAVNAMRRFRVQLPINIVCLAAVVLVAYFAIPQLGIMGAALAVLAGQCVTLSLYVVLVLRTIPRSG